MHGAVWVAAGAFRLGIQVGNQATDFLGDRQVAAQREDFFAETALQCWLAFAGSHQRVIARHWLGAGRTPRTIGRFRHTKISAFRVLAEVRLDSGNFRWESMPRR